MRYVLDILVVLMIAAAVGAYYWNQTREDETETVVQAVHTALEQLEVETKYRAATGQVEVNGRGFAISVDPAWFGGAAPRNSLVSPDRPWLEIASTDEALLEDPPVRVALDKDTAAFWYNPANGIMRARVGQRVSDRVALEQYNQINGTRLDSLFNTEPITPPELIVSIDQTESEPRRPRTLIRVRKGRAEVTTDPMDEPEAQPAPDEPEQTVSVPTEDALDAPQP